MFNFYDQPFNLSQHGLYFFFSVHGASTHFFEQHRLARKRGHAVFHDLRPALLASGTLKDSDLRQDFDAGKDASKPHRSFTVWAAWRVELSSMDHKIKMRDPRLRSQSCK